jgi:hypothetical protein
VLQGIAAALPSARSGLAARRESSARRAGLAFLPQGNGKEEFLSAVQTNGPEMVTLRPS